MIPKKIYYCWFGGNEKSTTIINNIKNWKMINPEYDIHEINETNFNIEKYAFAKTAYDLGKWAFVSDVARLSILHDNGGFYLDVDVELYKPLDPLLKEVNVWALESSYGIASGLIIGSEAKNKNLEDLLGIYQKTKFDINDIKTEMCTVPIVTEYFRKKGFKYGNNTVRLNGGEIILSTEYFAPKHFWGGGKVTNKTIGMHQYNASWLDKGLSFNFWEMLILHVKHKFPNLFFEVRKLKNRLRYKMSESTFGDD